MSSPESHIVDVLESAGEPLEVRVLRDRSGLDRDQFDTALARLRGREVLRKLDDTEQYRLTYWPDSSECILCREPVTSTEYYELELEAHGSNTEAETTGSLHADCARTLLDEVSLADRG